MANFRIPTVTELRKAGYIVEISHRRRYKTAHVDSITKKIVIQYLTRTKETLNNACETLFFSELLPKGGFTEVWITDPETSAEFYAFSTCPKSVNYSANIGVEQAIKRIIELMMVVNGTDGFTMKISV